MKGRREGPETVINFEGKSDFVLRYSHDRSPKR